MLRLKAKDVKDMKTGDTLTIKESKTGKDNILAVNKTVFKALKNILIIQSRMILISCFLQEKGESP